jgi:hypothetical protein
MEGKVSFLSVVSVLILAGSISPADQGKETCFSSFAISPKGEWVAAIVEERRLSAKDASGTQQVHIDGQWLFRVLLDGSGSSWTLLEKKAGKEVMESRINSVVVLDDGTVLGLRRSVLASWNPAGKKTERKEPELRKGFGWLVAHPSGKKALLSLKMRGVGEEPPEEISFIDPKTLLLDPEPALSGIKRFDVHWTPDEKFLFGVESVPGKPAWIEQPDGRRTPNEGYRLVRVDLKSGKRETVSDQVLFDGIIFGKDSIVWNRRGKDGKGVFRRAKMSPPFDLKEVPALNEWRPVLSLGGNRFLLRSLRGGRNRIADFESFDEKEFEEAKDLPLPNYDSIRFASGRGLLVLGTEPFTIELIDLKGNRKETVHLERSGAGAKKAKGRR